MESRKIRITYKAKCQCCGSQVARGDMGWYKKDYGVRCMKCGQHPADAPLAKKGKGRRRMPSAPRQSSPSPVPQMPSSNEPKMNHWVPDGTKAVQCSDGVYRYEWTSVTAAVNDAINTSDALSDYNKSYCNSRIEHALSGSDRWNHNYTRQKFEHDLANPPEHIMDAVEELKSEIDQEINVLGTAPRRKVRRGQEFGEEIDADRFLARIPNVWDRNVRELRERRIVTIGVNLAISGKHDYEKLLYRGAAALALADVLVQRGYNVGITLYESRTNPTSAISRFCSKVIVKEPQMPLDTASVAFSICEIAFFRTALAIGAVRKMPGKVDTCLGSPARLFENDRKEVDYMIDSDVLSKYAAIDWIKNAVAKTDKEVAHV
jgi:hypothetical protein